MDPGRLIPPRAGSDVRDVHPAKVSLIEAIPLTSLLPEHFDPKQYKVHFAVWNQIKHPIDVLATDHEEWQGWNSWRSVKNDFNREFIFSMAQDKHDATRWLFGGIWQVLERRPEQQAHSYTVAPREDLGPVHPPPLDPPQEVRSQHSPEDGVGPARNDSLVDPRGAVRR